MTYMDNPPPRRWRTRLERRPEDWTPDPELSVLADVIAEFPGYGVDQVLAEAHRRGVAVTRDFVCAVMEVEQ